MGATSRTPSSFPRESSNVKDAGLPKARIREAVLAHHAAMLERGMGDLEEVSSDEEEPPEEEEPAEADEGGRKEGKGRLPLRGQQFRLSFKMLFFKMLLFKLLLFKMRLCEYVNAQWQMEACAQITIVIEGYI